MDDRYMELEKKFEDLRKLIGSLLSLMAPETMFINRYRAELEMMTKKREILFNENKEIENDIELKKQMSKKIIETANEKADEILNAAHSRNAQSIKKLDEVKSFAEEVNLKHRTKELMKAVE